MGKTVVILGAGCIGLTTLLACKAMGASTIIVSDMHDFRGNTALELGADYYLNATTDITSSVIELTQGEGADVVFETAGNQKTATLTPQLLKRGGIIVMVGNIDGLTPIPFMDLMRKEGQIRTTFRYRNKFTTAIKVVEKKAIDIAKIVTHIYPFEETMLAFENCIHNQKQVIKTVVKFS